MVTDINERYQKLNPDGKLAMLVGQIRIIDAMDRMPSKSIQAKVARLHYGLDENAKLLAHLEELYTTDNGHTND